MVPQSECEAATPEVKALWFVGGPTKVDCKGHVHVMTRHEFKTPKDETDGEITEVPCCTLVNFIADVTWECVETPISGNSKSFQWVMKKTVKSFQIPEDTWNIGDRPTGPDQTPVVTEITAVKRDDCGAGSVECAHSITVTYDSIPDPNDVIDSVNLDVVTTVCYDTSDCEIGYKTTNIWVLAKGTEGAAQFIAGCV